MFTIFYRIIYSIAIAVCGTTNFGRSVRLKRICGTNPPYYSAANCIDYLYFLKYLLELFKACKFIWRHIMSIKELLDERIKEIERFAHDNGNEISYFVMLDILKDRSAKVDDLDIQYAEYILNQLGIRLLPDKNDEDYSSTDETMFVPSDVNITQIPATISNMMERIFHEEYDLEPEFQRNTGLWSDINQSRLIESLMLKIPLPSFYFDATIDDMWVVIDGIQRLTAFRNYLVGVKQNDGTYVKKRFTGLQYLKDFNGKTFDELPRQYIRRIKETNVVVYTVLRGTPDNVVRNIFQRINTGGITLNEQEIRQALYPGVGAELLKELAGCEEFKIATQYAIKPNRMLDREYVLRYIAFVRTDYKTEYKGNIDAFLVNALKTANKLDEISINALKEEFKDIMMLCHEIFGKYAFRKYTVNLKRSPINKALFESWSVCLSELTKPERKLLVTKRELLLREFAQLLDQDDYKIVLKAGDYSSVNKRISILRNFIKRYI